MARFFLPSQIELAKSLLEAKRAETEILEALVRQGLSLEGAGQLLSELRGGAPVGPTKESAPKADPKPSATPGAVATPLTADLSELPPSPKAAGAEPEKAVVARQRRWWIVWAITTLLLCAAAAAAVRALSLAAQRQHAETRALLARLEQSVVVVERGIKAAGGGKAGTIIQDPAWTQYRALATELSRRNLNQAELTVLETLIWRVERLQRKENPVVVTNGSPEIEVGAKGLLVAGKALRVSNALEVILHTLGTPTRTNRVEQSQKQVYAYDHHGILLYHDEGTAEASLVLDLDGRGGTHGAESRFTGTFKLNGALIPPDTDSRTLAARKLDWKNAPGDGGILAARCRELDLCFAYFKDLQRLSLIEIDLK